MRFFFRNVNLSFDTVHRNLIISVWKWTNTMNILSALWILMAWCFSTRASVATVLSKHPCISSCFWVNNCNASVGFHGYERINCNRQHREIQEIWYILWYGSELNMRQPRVRSISKIRFFFFFFFKIAQSTAIHQTSYSQRHQSPSKD